MTRPIATLASAAVCMCALVAAASAQQRVRLSGGPTLAQLRVHSTGSTFPEEARSAAEIGFEGTVGFRRLSLRLRYAQADFPFDTLVFDRQAAAAELALIGQLLPWLRLGAGTRRRSFDSESSQRIRWNVWEAIAAAEFPIFEKTVSGSAELRAALAGSLDAPGVTEAWGRGFAGEVGMRIALPRIPVWLRFGYQLEMQRLAGNVREDVVDGLTVLLGVGTR